MGLDTLLRRLRGRLSGAEVAPPGGLTPRERAIYNEGERLIPGRTHGVAEVVRHTSSYAFFRMIIEADLAFIGPGRPLHRRILHEGRDKK